MIPSKSFIASTLLVATIALNNNVNGQSSSSIDQNHQFDPLMISRRWADHTKHLFRRNKKVSNNIERSSIDEMYDAILEIQKRQDPAMTLAQQIQSEQSTNPVAAAQLVQTIPYLANNASGVTATNFQLVQGDSNEAQLPWNSNVPFVQGAATNATTAGGWEFLPQVQGFTLNRSWEIVPGAIMPFYSTSGLDPAQIKRAVITYPGKPRDAWLYASLYSNALQVAYYNQSSGVANNSVLMISPFWGNQLDSQAGSLQPKEIYFHGSGWMDGGSSSGPNLTHRLTAYEIMDNFTDMLFDKAQFPNLNQVVIAGHSMGGQAAHRYAVLKKQKKYDNNMSFWVGNPGSWSYLSTDRPYYNSSCNDTYNVWEYGLGQPYQNITKYARYAVQTDLNWVVKTYVNRNVHMALGLLDNGAGDTHCQARDQGGNHLDRGSQYVLHLQKVNNGTFPASQTVDFIGNTSHQDFAMISANQSIYWMFVNNYNVSFPDIVPYNPTNHTKTHNSSMPTMRAYATHGNELLASGLLGGSLILIIIIFGLAPFAFRSNFNEEEFQSSLNRGISNSKFNPFPVGKEGFQAQFTPLARHDTFGSGTTVPTGMPLIDVADNKSYSGPPTYN